MIIRFYDQLDQFRFSFAHSMCAMVAAVCATIYALVVFIYNAGGDVTQPMWVTAWFCAVIGVVTCLLILGCGALRLALTPVVRRIKKRQTEQAIRNVRAPY